MNTYAPRPGACRICFVALQAAMQDARVRMGPSVVGACDRSAPPETEARRLLMAQ